MQVTTQMSEPEKAGRSPWADASAAEIRVARAAADSLAIQSTQQRIAWLERLGEWFAGKRGASAADDFGIVTNELVSSAVPESFARTEDVVSSNVFAELWRELAIRDGSMKSHGVVATPRILVTSMVRLTALFRTNKSEHSAPAIRQSSAMPDYNGLAEATWYDPCVGAGAFPLAILELCDSLDLPLDRALERISGVDIDPVATTITRIRMALYASEHGRIAYSGAYEGLEQRIQTGDALASLGQQGFDHRPTFAPGSFSLCVGNPPYVRGDCLTRATKASLRQSSRDVGDGFSDLYMYFIAHAIDMLSSRGMATLITPSTFQRTRSGRKLREVIARSAAVKALFDFDELPVFREAALHPIVLVLQRDEPQGSFRNYTFPALPDAEPLTQGLSRATLADAASINARGWTPVSTAKARVLRSVEAAGPQLQYHVPAVHSGIKTGHAAAYLLSPSQGEAMVADSLSRPHVRPVLTPRSIRPWKSAWDGSYLIAPSPDVELPESSAAFRHLLHYRDHLTSRSDLRNGRWYSLRACSYFAAFAEPKIAFPDIASECRFSIDTSGSLLLDGAFFLPTSDWAFVALLNSSVADFYFRARCSSIGNPETKGRLRFKRVFVKEFPLPVGFVQDESVRRQLSALALRARSNESRGVQAAIEEANAIALDLYGLTPNDLEGKS